MVEVVQPAVPAPKRRRTTSYQFGEYFCLSLVTLKTGFGYILKDGVYLIGCGPQHSEESLVVIEKLYDNLVSGIVRPDRYNVEHERAELISSFRSMRELNARAFSC